MFLWLLFYQAKVIQKPENAMKSSESCKNCMAECQTACKRDFRKYGSVSGA